MDEPRYDAHYLKTVTALGDVCEVITSQPIFTRNRIKLVDKGVRVTSELFERLVRHKLAPPIDECLTIGDAVTAASLKAQAKELVEGRPQFAAVRESASTATRLLRAIGNIPLARPLAFKLTVARERQPGLFSHSLQTAIIAVYLGIRAGLIDTELTSLAAAAMLHDIGELHIDSEFLASKRRLSEAERRHIYTHPVTAFLILNEYAQYRPDIATAVIEHHERLDGSGYPRGLQGEEISFLGQILMLAEVAGSLVGQDWEADGSARLAVGVKMSYHKFNRRLIDHLAALWSAPPASTGETPTTLEEELRQCFARLAQIIRDWNAAYAGLAQASHPLAEFVNLRVTQLERMVSEAGFDAEQPEALFGGTADDPAPLAELRLLAREFQWQLREIMYETRRRWDELATGDEAGKQRVEDWCARAEAALQAA